jgi:hypothetical protein
VGWCGEVQRRGGVYIAAGGAGRDVVGMATTSRCTAGTGVSGTAAASGGRSWVGDDACTVASWMASCAGRTGSMPTSASFKDVASCRVLARVRVPGPCLACVWERGGVGGVGRHGGLRCTCGERVVSTVWVIKYLA